MRASTVTAAERAVICSTVRSSFSANITAAASAPPPLLLPLASALCCLRWLRRERAAAASSGLSMVCCKPLSTVLNKYNSRMEASVAGFVLHHPGREWRRPCAAPSCDVGEGL